GLQAGEVAGKLRADVDQLGGRAATQLLGHGAAEASRPRWAMASSVDSASSGVVPRTTMRPFGASLRITGLKKSKSLWSSSGLVMPVASKTKAAYLLSPESRVRS